MAVESAIGRVWRRRFVQRAAVLIALIAAAGLQYRLVNMPVGDVERTGRLSPAKVRALAEVVSFGNPESSSGRFSFTYAEAAESHKKMVEDAYFERAQLSPETRQQFSKFGIQAPAELAAITYLTSAKGSGNCATRIEVTTSTARSGSRAVQFSQSEIVPSERYRLLETRMNGIDSVVTLSSQGTFAVDGSSPCQATLSIGDWTQVTAGFVRVKLQVPAGSSFRFRWEASDVQPSGWSASGAPVPLLMFGNPPEQGFHVEALAIAAFEHQASQPGASRLAARSERKGSPLKIDSFLVGTDRLEVGASGRGIVVEDGRTISAINLIEAIGKYPIISALFGAANVALLNWARRKFFRR